MSKQTAQEPSTYVDVAHFGSNHETRVDPNTLIGAEFNPDGRTTAGALADLEKQVILAGNRILVPIHVTKDGHVIDGHRRSAVARHLGIDVPAIVWENITHKDGRFGEMFVLLNVAVRKLTQKEQLHVALKGGPASPKIAVLRDYVFDTLGEGSFVFELFVEKTAAPQVIDNAVRAFSVIKSDGLVDKKDERSWVSRIVEYQLVKHQQQDLKLYLTEANREAVSRPKRPRFSARRLFDSIKGNEPLNLGN